ncbi:UpxY family transcription antiterminator [Carboxylicivirga mesophila]|uniref:UpxY family transcription antiterminator n=1 Tax=Carboxylicivirga mesophila TaxID=1166478 RepID=A0ABS5K850_9BACT|nr:UpxY family transcription antiterminator [Carboxylicivirga mesophila]MBS2211042.1 UpxY family transcription antiterminator [Carboxylicivirga mesophila]
MEKKQEASWYALYTKSRAEKKVFEQLTAMGIETYLPLKKTLRQWSDRKKWVEMPVISSYIFIKIPKTDYQKVFDVNGIVAYVSYKGKACIIPENDILAMKRAIENQMEFSVESGQIEKGQQITVTSGPLEGIKGEVIEIQGAKKIILRINQIGYTLVVNLDSATFKTD